MYVASGVILLLSAYAISLSRLDHGWVWLAWAVLGGLSLRRTHVGLRWRQLQFRSPSSLEVMHSGRYGTPDVLEWSGVARFGPLLRIRGTEAGQSRDFLLVLALLEPESRRQLERVLALMKLPQSV